jgi:hypothetical protein
MRLIWVDKEAEYFRAEGLTGFRKIGSDLLCCNAPSPPISATHEAERTSPPLIGKKVLDNLNPPVCPNVRWGYTQELHNSYWVAL